MPYEDPQEFDSYVKNCHLIPHAKQVDPMFFEIVDHNITHGVACSLRDYTIIPNAVWDEIRETWPHELNRILDKHIPLTTGLPRHDIH